MVDRREVLLDAAIEVVGTQGMRALTHRAVDRAAGLPAGSTSNVFRTREALVVGIVERYVALEREMATGPGDEVERTPAGVAEALGGFARRAIGADRTVTLARYAMLVEKAQHPELRGITAFGAERVNEWALALIGGSGSLDPARDLDLLSNYVTGLVLHELSNPSPDLDPVARVRSLIDTLDWSTP